MRFSFCFAILMLFGHFYSKSQDIGRMHSISIHSGIILEDGFVYAKSPPAIGLGYSFQVHKYFSLDASVISFYKTHFGSSILNDREGFNIILRNSNSVFISQADRDRITNVGIKDISSIKTVKYLFLPLSVCINIKPIRIGRSHLGIGIGTTGIYGTYKAGRDQEQLDITLKDGSVLKNLTFQQEIEFRNLVFGGSYSKLYYKCDLGSSRKNALQLSLHSYNFFWSPRNTYTHHLLTLDFNSSF